MAVLRSFMLVTAIGVVVLVQPAGAVPFTNGSCETGTNPPASGFSTLVAGTPNATNIDGWTVTAGSVDWMAPGAFQASAGQRDVDLSGDGPGTLSQTFDIIGSTLYRVLFDLSGNPQGGPSTKTLMVSAAGTSSL